MKNKEQISKIWDVLDSLNVDVLHNKQAIIKLENEREQPKLKQLDQSVFDGLGEKWRFAAVDEDGALFKFEERPDLTDNYWTNVNCSGFDRVSVAGVYDTTNWKNSLIERDLAKELLEVDLSSELTGSELCKAMLGRGDKFVVCKLADTSEADAISNSMAKLVTEYDGDDFYHELADSYWHFAVPINNQGEPLTASEVGL